MKRSQIAAVVVVAAVSIVGMVVVVQRREPAGCTDGVAYGLSREGYDGHGNPSEDLDLVIPEVDAIVQVTVLEDIVALSDKYCENYSTPSHTVRVRVDEVLYSDLSEWETPAVGDEIEISTVDTSSGLSADPDSRAGRQQAIVAIEMNRTNRATGERVPWLAYGRNRVWSTSDIAREAWEEAIAEAATNQPE